MKTVERSAGRHAAAARVLAVPVALLLTVVACGDDVGSDAVVGGQTSASTVAPTSDGTRSSETTTTTELPTTDTDVVEPSTTVAPTTTPGRVCQFVPGTDAPNPFGMRAVLRFEDREIGSAVVYEGFGNALSDGASRRQALTEASAVEAFEAFVDGDPFVESRLVLPIDADLRDEISATFACAPVDGDLPVWTGYEQLVPGRTAAECAYDPALGPNPLGMRAFVTVTELENAGDGPTTVVVYEHFGNAAGDGAAWHHAVFSGSTATEAWSTYLDDPSFLADATGDSDTDEVRSTLDLMADVYTCS